MIKEAIKKTVDNIDLSIDEAAAVMGEIMSGEATPSQISCLLTALRIKGETADEVTGFARKMREHAVKINSKYGDIVDTCGTGGDFSGTFNISTISAITAAAAGIRVAKHGNRSASSKCGSADILEAMGVKIDLPPDKVKRSIDEVGIGFIFAPNFHPAMKYAAPSRKEIGIRTIFNILGPLTNPAGTKYQLLGVFSEELTELMSLVLQNLGSTEVMVVHGMDGLDEITVTDRTKISHLKNGNIKDYFIEPKNFRMNRYAKEELAGGTVNENVKITNDILKGSEKGAKRDIVLLNTAAALVIGQAAKDINDGITKAKEAIDSGAALKKLQELIKFTNS
ncbi:MAG: anthranilate phosphoribosyltransferase [bacterium]